MAVGAEHHTARVLFEERPVLIGAAGDVLLQGDAGHVGDDGRVVGQQLRDSTPAVAEMGDAHRGARVAADERRDGVKVGAEVRVDHDRPAASTPQVEDDVVRLGVGLGIPPLRVVPGDPVDALKVVALRVEVEVVQAGHRHDVGELAEAGRVTGLYEAPLQLHEKAKGRHEYPQRDRRARTESDTASSKSWRPPEAPARAKSG